MTSKPCHTGSRQCLKGKCPTMAMRIYSCLLTVPALWALLGGAALPAAAGASPNADARPLAFPGAEGFGRHASGGRGGEVCHVTNLNDAGAGSFRDAVSQPGRTVVFDVGGVMALESPVSVSSNITIAGQTAPGDGIVLHGDQVSFSHSDNVIVRCLRVRMGAGGTSGKDAVSIYNGHTMIFDHVSVSWGRDENFSITGSSHDITIQDSIIAEGLQTHSCGGLVEADGVSILRSLYVNNHTRNPKVKGRNQFVNNVVYNWGVAAYIEGDSAGQSTAAVLNNVFVAGPESAAAPFTRGNLNFNIYASGNVYDDDLDGVFDARALVREDHGTVTWLETPPDFPPVTVLRTDEALARVLGGAGCSLRRDAVDTRLVRQVESFGKAGRSVRDEAEAGGIGEVRGHAPPKDADRDGMPDEWERAHGLNPALPEDRNGDSDGDGYTNLEEYLNERAGQQAASAAAGADGQGLELITVSADGAHFAGARTGRRFLAWGCNYDHDESGRLLEDYWTDEWQRVEEDFAEMRELGANVVRVHLQLGRFMRAPDQPDPAALNQLQRLLRLAEQTRLYLDLTGLGCYHKQDVPEWYDILPEARRWAVQARFWEAVAEVCASSNAVFCYDLMNEPILPGAGKPETEWLTGELGGKYFVQRLTLDLAGRTREQVAKAWVDTLVAAIRRHDTRRMITVGAIPWALPFPNAKPLFYSPSVGASLDFVSVHFYPRAGEIEKALAALAVYDTGKPLVIEEIFPLHCSAAEACEFIDRSRPLADGWISFYWGKTAEEYAQEKGLPAAIKGEWLRRFREKGKEVLEGDG